MVKKIDIDTVTYNDLNGRTFTIGFPSSSSDVYSDKGALPVGFKFSNLDVYKFVLSDPAQVADPEGKGKLVVHVDPSAGVTWLQDRDLDDQYEQLDTVNSKIAGNANDSHNIGIAMLQAVQQHIWGSLNTNAYDTYKLSLDEIAEALGGDDETVTVTETQTVTKAPVTTTETQTQTQAK